MTEPGAPPVPHNVVSPPEPAAGDDLAAWISQVKCPALVDDLHKLDVLNAEGGFNPHSNVKLFGGPLAPRRVSNSPAGGGGPVPVWEAIQKGSSIQWQATVTQRLRMDYRLWFVAPGEVLAAKSTSWPPSELCELDVRIQSVGFHLLLLYSRNPHFAAGNLQEWSTWARARNASGSPTDYSLILFDRLRDLAAKPSEIELTCWRFDNKKP